MKILKDFMEKRKIRKQIRRDKISEVKRVVRKWYEARLEVEKSEMEADKKAMYENYQKKKKEIREQAEIEILNIRDEVRQQYRPRIRELKEEIKRLNDYIKDNRDFYEATRKRESEFDDLVKRVAEKFDRASEKVDDIRQLVLTAKGDSASFTRKYAKKDKKEIDEV